MLLKKVLVDTSEKKVFVDAVDVEQIEISIVVTYVQCIYRTKLIELLFLQKDWILFTHSEIKIIHPSAWAMLYETEGYQLPLITFLSLFHSPKNK